MTLLLSNHSPVTTWNAPFDKTFLEHFEKAESLDIAIGYVSAKSLEYLSDLISKKKNTFCNLIIGMHYFDKFSYSQYAAAKDIDKLFSEHGLGAVHLVTEFPYHGKVYSFKLKDGKVVSIVGSSNLSNVVIDKPSKQYEVDVLIDDGQVNSDLSNFLDKLREASPKLSSPDLEIKDFKKTKRLVERDDNTEASVSVEQKDSFESTLFVDRAIEIPISTAGKSSLNVYFGKGRENTNTGVIRPRGWYEVELIIPSHIRKLPNFPLPNASEKHKTIEVITDDGYSFNCTIGGDSDKNLRSEYDLKILGRWLKGRLENAGVLSFGQLVTEEVLKNYGRDSITMIPSNEENKWYFDFGVGAENIVDSTKIDELKLLKEKGVHINYDDIVHRNDNLLEYKGQQIIVYVSDYSLYGQFSIIEGTSNYSPYSFRRFHFASCRHIRKELDYFATQRKDGKFLAEKTPKGDIETRMIPCGDCLKKLNYKNFRTIYGNERSEIVNNFDVADFFESCKSKFS